MSKTCVKCDRTLPLDEFGKGSKTPDGLRSDCRDCQNQYQRQWRRTVREQGTLRAQLLAKIDVSSNPVGEWVTSETRGRGDCNVEGCDEPHFTMRLCNAHYILARSLGNLPPRPEMVECRDCRSVIIVSSTGPVPVMCPMCRQAEARKADPRKPYKHRKRVLDRYGLSAQDYKEMLDQQGGLCAICGGQPDVGHGKKNGYLSIDHDHETEAVRGLLCHHCNLMLGNAKDSTDILRNAIRYLESA